MTDGGDYAGFVTRFIAFGVDLVIINVVAAAVALVVGLAASALGVSQSLVNATLGLGGLTFLLWSAGYFVTFWSTAGQTPGARLMGIRVMGAEGEPAIRPRRAVVRLFGMALAALPCFAGYLLVLVDDRRRGLHDRLARTVVVYVPQERRVVRRATAQLG